MEGSLERGGAARYGAVLVEPPASGLMEASGGDAVEEACGGLPPDGGDNGGVRRCSVEACGEEMVGA